MNAHDILLIIQYLTVSVLFIEILIVFSRWKNPIHSYLVLAFITSFLSNLGYLFELKAQSEEAYIAALKLSYAGRVWIVLAFFLFSARMCRIHIPKWITAFLVLIHVGIYMSVVAIGSNGFYYKDYEFVADPVFPRFYHTNGYMHDLFMALNATLIFLAILWVIREFRKEKSRISKQRLFMLIMSFGVQALFFIIHVTEIFGISRYYDLTMPGTLLGTIFMLIGIIGFDLLGTREIARDFAIDRISEGVIAVDNDGKIQYYNEPAAKLYPQFDNFFSVKNIKEDDTDDENAPLRIVTPYDIISDIEDAVKEGETLKIGDRIYSPEENDLQYKGESYGKLYALVDDTEHFRYMEELQEQRDIADHANEAKSRFLASMSHEIRTPINAMLGMDEMILRESKDKTIRSYASDIMAAGKTLLSLVNDILDLSKVEEGKMEIIPVQYDMASLINDLVHMTRDRAEKKELSFFVQADEHMPRILFGDEIRVKQCATNILTNAVKYTEKGQIDLEIGFEKKDEKHIDLCITVKDTGIGMKEEDMKNLFSPYKRLEEERNRSIEGTGLGMSITRQLLDLMDSELKVESTYGEGSVFSFTVTQEVVNWDELGDYSHGFDAMSTSAYEYRELFHAPEAKILVIDDTEINITVIKNLLKKTCIQIDTALSGKDGLELAKVNTYDAIFIDHMMPEMNGIETLERLRKLDLNKEVPAIALTANAVSGAREMYLEAGFTDYLAKPVEGERIEKLLMDILPEDKIDTNVSVSEEIKEDELGDQLAWLNEIEEIDTKAGLLNCGSEDGYASVLLVFHQTAKDKANEIEKFFDQKDIENYTIKVHALKSSARIIGAAKLSNAAKELEDAGNEGDTAFIEKNTADLLSMYRELDLKLKKLDETDESLPKISEASLKEAYQTIVEIAGSMDYALMDDLLKDIKGYALKPEDKQVIGKIEGLLSELNWDGIIEKAKEKI